MCLLYRRIDVGKYTGGVSDAKDAFHVCVCVCVLLCMCVCYKQATFQVKQHFTEMSEHQFLVKAFKEN